MTMVGYHDNTGTHISWPWNFRLYNHKSLYHSSNCIAWGAKDEAHWWWPDPLAVSYWPEGVPREETMNSFFQAFETLGYQHDIPDQDMVGQRIAIYAKSGVPNHISRELENGRWTSKLGVSFDIEHDLDGLEGEVYRQVVAIMIKPNP